MRLRVRIDSDGRDAGANGHSRAVGYGGEVAAVAGRNRRCAMRHRHVRSQRLRMRIVLRVVGAITAATACYFLFSAVVWHLCGGRVQKARVHHGLMHYWVGARLADPDESPWLERARQASVPAFRMLGLQREGPAPVEVEAAIAKAIGELRGHAIATHHDADWIDVGELTWSLSEVGTDAEIEILVASERPGGDVLAIRRGKTWSVASRDGGRTDHSPGGDVELVPRP